jgi:hypothetical protein
MSNQEFSNEFDILYNNIASNQAPGLDLYEKSVYLTLAEEQLALTYYNGKNSSLESFEKTEELRRYLATLVRTEKLTPEGTSSLYPHKSAVFTLPSKLWFITYEKAEYASDEDRCAAGKDAFVVPVTQDDLEKTLENPFRGPNLRRVLRLDIEDNQIELLSKYRIANYTVRYLEYISPIVLTDLDDGLTVNGESQETECKFPEGLHRTILELAVNLAAATYKAK